MPRDSEKTGGQQLNEGLKGADHQWRKDPGGGEDPGDQGGAWKQMLGTPQGPGHYQLSRTLRAQIDIIFCPTFPDQQPSPSWEGKMRLIEYSTGGWVWKVCVCARKGFHDTIKYNLIVS